jgi:hypothetical protein
MERGMVVPLHDDQRVAARILARDEPRRGVAAAGAADSQSLPLPERVVGESLVAPDLASVDGDDRAPRR